MNIAEKHTFIVCAYKESEYLEECLQSLVKQESKSAICIATSTPSDFLSDMAQKYDVPLYVRQGKSNIADDWNFAISVAQTPYVTIAHQDDVYLPEYSKKVLAAFQKRETPLIFFSDYAEKRDVGIVTNNILLRIKRLMMIPLRKEKNWDNIKIRRKILSLGSVICCPSVAFNLEVLRQPIFNTDMKCDLDWNAWERMSKQCGSFCYEPTILMYHRIHQESETTSLIHDDTRGKEDLRMLEKFWPSSTAKVINYFYSMSQKSNGS